MKLHFEEEDFSERQECSALTSNMEGTALNCVVAKKQYQRDTAAEKIFEILLNRFGSGVQGHQAMMRFQKRRQRENETIDKFLDDLEMLRRRQTDESNRRMDLAAASKFIDVVKNDGLRTMLATHYTPLSTTRCDPILLFAVVRYTVFTGIYISQDCYGQICGPFVVIVL